ncbi:MAG TPA: hypothetical protein VGF13_00740, partial [Verrucomicrobiae bacterium]
AILHPKTQWRVQVRLDEIFKMDVPGEYLVTGVTGVDEPSLEIRSKSVLIRVLAKDSAVPLDKDPPFAKVANLSPSGTPSATTTLAEPGKGHDSTETVKAPFAAPSEIPLSEASPAVSFATSSAAASKSSNFSPARKIGTGILTLLMLLLLAILGRAARRKRAG